MARSRVRRYLDVAETWPDKTAEEHDELIREADEESKKLEKWPKI